MALDPIESPTLDFILQVERFYASLIQTAGSAAATGSEPSLGGKLLYAGELDLAGRALLVAGNIAGAASLAATSEQAAQKQAIRDGVADFLVTSLDEALRILKNELRKREAVAVCVSTTPKDIQKEMIERGVLPDLLQIAGESSPFLSQGAMQVQPAPIAAGSVQLIWHVAAAPAQWLPKLDSIALGCLDDREWAARRWLRLAPRYLGRLAKGMRALNCLAESADRFVERARFAIARGEIDVAVELQTTVNGVQRQDRYSPPASSIRAHNSLIP
jgi:hypothetical protein